MYEASRLCVKQAAELYEQTGADKANTKTPSTGEHVLRCDLVDSLNDFRNAIESIKVQSLSFELGSQSIYPYWLHAVVAVTSSVQNNRSRALDWIGLHASELAVRERPFARAYKILTAWDKARSVACRWIADRQPAVTI